MNNEIEELKLSIESQHGGKATLVQSVPVKETFKGKTVWEGVVSVFDLECHPNAKRAYAWASPIEGSEKRRFFAVLHLPPIEEPQDVVKMAIAAEYQAQQAGETG